jgi:DNA-binding beta-propeller fold protein YncE
MQKFLRIGAMLTCPILAAGLAAVSGPAFAQMVSMNVYTVPVGDSSSSIVNGVIFDGTYIWAAIQNPDGGVVEKLSTSGTVISTTGVGTEPLEMAFDGKNIWVTDYTSSDITIVSQNGNYIKTISLPLADPEGIAFDGQSMWVANNGNNTDTVSKFDAASMTLVANYATGRSPDGVAFDGKNIWVTNSYGGTVWVFNLSGIQIHGYATGVFPLSMAFDGKNMWIGNGTGVNVGTPVAGIGSLTKIRVADGRNMGTFTIGNHVRGLVFDGISVWACNGNDNTVSRVRVSDVALMGTYPTGQLPRAVAFDGGKIWVANSGENTLTVFVPPAVSAQQEMAQSAAMITGYTPAVVQYRAIATLPQPAAWMPVLLDNN